jgi:dihydrofolate synthase/folylpolyglutamate synthase
LGQPQRAYASVHIAGTNGKGSTAAFTASALQAAGYRTGLYTSPHLERLTERIRVNGAELTPQALARATTEVSAATERLLASGALPHQPSFFEVMTAIGFLAFAEAMIEWAVVEVGLGGRLDATNVVAPRIAVITPIGMDHEAYLGSTLAAIAGEKAGIIKPGIERAITARQAPEAMAVLERRAREVGVPLEVAPEPPRIATDDEGCCRLTVAYQGAELKLAPPLRGRHQADNAALAARVCERLGLPPEAVARGVAQVHWPGRLEKIGEHPPVYVDGAHNPLAARTLAAFLDEFALHHPAPILIYGTMRDKAVGEISEWLFPRARAVVLTAPRQPRALAPEALARACGALAKEFEVAADYPAALAAARRLSAGRIPIVVTGSLYLAGEALALAQQEVSERRAC